MASSLFQPMMESRPIRDIAYEVLKHSIVSGEIPAGSRIVETEYAERLHISRTPLREALRKLERDGLVEYEPRRGVIVRAFTVDDVEQIYTIRNTLEMLTVPGIIANAEAEDVADLRRRCTEMEQVLLSGDYDALSPLARSFHGAIIQLSRQNRILRVIESQDEYITRFSAMAIKQEDHLPDAHQEHVLLVDYIEQRREKEFGELLRRHIDRSKEMCLAALKQQKAQKALKDEGATK